jgi:hypothetical protein
MMDPTYTRQDLRDEYPALTEKEIDDLLNEVVETDEGEATPRQPEATHRLRWLLLGGLVTTLGMLCAVYLTTTRT